MSDESAEVEEAPEKWWLITQLPPAKPGSKADLEILREVSGEELREVRRANAFLNRVANAAPYARLVEIYEQLEETLVRGNHTRSWQRATTRMNRASRVLGQVAAGFPDEIQKHARNDFGGESEELRQLEAAIAEECARPFVKALLLHSRHLLECRVPPATTT